MGSALGIDWSHIAYLVFGALATLIARAIQVRRSRIRWKVFHQHLAASSNHPQVGNIEVTLNGQPMTNLVLSTVIVENDFLRDFKDLTLHVRTEPTHEIVADEARRGQDSATVSWSARFTKAVEQAVKEAAENQAPGYSRVQNWREYTVPVLNRGETLNITLVVHALPPAKAACGLETETVGAVLRFQKKAPPDILGVHPLVALAWGMVLSIPIGELLGHYMNVAWRPVGFFLLGILICGVGVLPVLAYRWVRNRLV